MEIVKKLLFLLSPRESKRALLLMVMILIMGLLDVIGVASILPFMAVLTNPELIITNSVLNTVYNELSRFGVNSTQHFIFVLGTFVFFLLVVSLCFKAVTNYVQLKFINMREYSIGKRLLKNYLYQNYSWFLNRNSAELGKSILSETSEIVSNGIRPLINLFAQGFISFIIIILLIVADPKLALIIGLTLILAYGIIFKLSSGLLRQIGKKRLSSNSERFSILAEAF